MGERSGPGINNVCYIEVVRSWEGPLLVKKNFCSTVALTEFVNLTLVVYVNYKNEKLQNIEGRCDFLMKKVCMIF